MKKKQEVDAQAGFVHRKYLNGGVVVKEDETPILMKVRQFSSEPAKVSVEMRQIKKLGDFVSFHCHVGLTIPCYAEEVDDAYEVATRWVRGRLNKELADTK